MKYIAIDTRNFKNFSESDREQVIQRFSKYEVDVIETTLDQLEQEGQLMDAGSLERLEHQSYWNTSMKNGKSPKRPIH